jgi:hypothetical protein
VNILKTIRRKALWIGPLLVALLVAGCSGIKPYEPHDYRREGPQRGLFSGSKGEFIIYRKAGESETDSRSDETTNNAQQKMDNEEKKIETKNGEQKQ